jgi:hypothetical protein
MERKSFFSRLFMNQVFRREGEGPKNTKEKKVAMLYMFIISKKLGWKLT